MSMLTGWFAHPPGSRNSTDEDHKSDGDDDTQIMEPDQGNGKLLFYELKLGATPSHGIILGSY